MLVETGQLGCKPNRHWMQVGAVNLRVAVHAQSQMQQFVAGHFLHSGFVEVRTYPDCCLLAVE